MKLSKIFTSIGLMICTLVISGFTVFAQSSTQEWFVADKTVDCTGVAPQKCLLVREATAREWQLFYGQIKGFKFRENYTQRIRVKVTPRKKTPADASSLAYKLVKVVNQSKTDGSTSEEARRQMTEANPPAFLIGQKWILKQIDGAKVESNNAFIEFDGQNNRFSARVCNRISGSFTLSGTNLKIGNSISTKMACAEPLNSMETTFLNALEKVTRVEQDGDTLTLFAGNTPLLQFKATLTDRIPE